MECSISVLGQSKEEENLCGLGFALDPNELSFKKPIFFKYGGGGHLHPP